MGQLKITGKDRVAFVESVTVADVQALAMNQARLSSITNDSFGIIDDCMVTKREDHLYMVINAGCFDKDMAHLTACLTKAKGKGLDVHIEVIGGSLVAVQGPKASSVLSSMMALHDLPFMFVIVLFVL